MKAAYYVCFREYRGPNRRPQWAHWRKVASPRRFDTLSEARERMYAVTRWRGCMHRTQVAVFHRGELVESVGAEPADGQTTPTRERLSVVRPY